MTLITKGLAFLFAIVAGIVPAFLEFFAKWVTQKSVFLAAYYAAYALLALGIFASLQVSFSVLTVALPPGFAQAAGMFLPSNAYTCLSSYITAIGLRWIYDYQVKLLDVSSRYTGL